MAGQIGYVGGIDVAPTLCGVCGTPANDCMRRLIRTSALGKGKKQGAGGKACCGSCAIGNTHPYPDNRTCAEVGAEWAKQK